MYNFTDSDLQSSLGLNPMNDVGKKDCRYSVVVYSRDLTQAECSLGRL